MDFFGLRSFFLIVFVFASTLHGFHSQPIRTPFLNVRTGDSPVSLVEPRPAVVVTGRGGSTTAATWTYFRNSTQDNSYGFGSATARTRVIYPENRVPFPTDKRSTSPLISSWISWYMKALKQRPLLTKASTAAVVQVLGDATSQPLSAYSAGRVFVYDYPRTLCFALVGFFFKAPFLHSWYGITAGFGQRLQRLYRWNDGQRIAAELALDQSVGVLAFLPAYFYVYEFFSALVAGRGELLGLLTCLQFIRHSRNALLSCLFQPLRFYHLRFKAWALYLPPFWRIIPSGHFPSLCPSAMFPNRCEYCIPTWQQFFGTFIFVRVLRKDTSHVFAPPQAAKD